MRYVALLRGINVGGKSPVRMSELKATFEDVGMSAVRTYINSGNVLFTSPLADRARLAEMLEDAIRQRFDLETLVLLRTIEDLRALVEAIPPSWTNDATMKCDVVFLDPETDSPSIVETLGPRQEIEDALYVPGALVWRVDRGNATRSRLLKIVGTPLYQHVTVRNCNTARKLLQLVEDQRDD